MVTIKFVDLFAGIGGIRLGFESVGFDCIFSSEWDRFAQQTYQANFGHLPFGDITKINVAEIPSHNILAAGFPCQAFSNAGKKAGFLDCRGAMFFEIQRILETHQPDCFFLENVKQLKTNDAGKTFDFITNTLTGKQSFVPDDFLINENTKNKLKFNLEYEVFTTVLNASNFGLPQKRERLYFVGFNKKKYPNINFNEIFKWPTPGTQITAVSNILMNNVPDKFTISDRLWAGHQKRKIQNKINGKGFGYGLVDADSPVTRTLSARYYKDGSEILIDQKSLNKNPRKLTPRECANLQGFPSDFKIESVSEIQAYKQLGNSVAVPVIKEIAREIQRTLNQLKLNK
jgi:DNA (cytosine-5)-methyltransferase 1